MSTIDAEVLDRLVQEPRFDLHRGVVDHHVDPPGRAEHGRHDLADARLVTDIAHEPADRSGRSRMASAVAGSGRDRGPR